MGRRKIIRKNGRFFDLTLAATLLTGALPGLGRRSSVMTLRTFRLDRFGDRMTILKNTLATQGARKSTEHAQGYKH